MDVPSASANRRDQLIRLRNELAVYESALRAAGNHPKMQAILFKVADTQEAISEIEQECDRDLDSPTPNGPRATRAPD